MQRYLSNKAALFLAPFSAGLLLVAPLNQPQAQPNGGVVVPTEVHRVVIDGTSSNDIENLINALSMPNPTTVLGQLMPIVIELSCGLQLPLTGRHSIPVNSFRSVVAPPACARGLRTPVERVPRIFVTDHRAGQPLFVVGGDHVVFSGFRLEGPIQGKDIPGQTSRLEKAIRIQESGESAPTLGAIRSIEVSNMEIFHWSGAGIDVLDNNSKAARGRLFNTGFVGHRMYLTRTGTQSLETASAMTGKMPPAIPSARILFFPGAAYTAHHLAFSIAGGRIRSICTEAIRPPSLGSPRASGVAARQAKRC